jgi:uncharacterized phage protein gp47/JayE
MAEFTLKSFQQILSDMIAKVGAETPITDITAGSVIITLLEAAATEDANTYIQMLNIIRSYNLDTTTGTDLDDRAYEYGLTRLEANYSNGAVTFSDSAFDKIATTIYMGLAGPSAGSVSVFVTSVTDFPPLGGSLIVGRGTNNVETAPYASITNMGAYYRFNLTAPLAKDHGTDETIILSQGGDRVIPAGTVVYVPESDLTNQIDFILQADATILDGETEVLNSTVICGSEGSIGNINIGAIKLLSTLPFSTCEVTNPAAFSSGRDVETDEELRERIKLTIQSLSRGTETAILTAATQVFSSYQNNKVISASFVEATTLNELNFLYIDDGVGLEPMFTPEAYQLLIEYAAGGEKFLQLDNDKTPLTKGCLVTQNSEPFGIIAGQTLTVRVGGTEQQTLTFGGVDMFAIPGAATAEEVASAINDNIAFVEARTSDNKTKVVIEALQNTSEQIQVVGGTANTSLGFKEGIDVHTLKLYKNDVLLYKDGVNAFIISGNPQTYALVPGMVLDIVVDGKPTTQTITFGSETTAQEVCDTINLSLIGATAISFQRGVEYYVMITSDNPTPSSSAIQITGGTANAILGFSTTAVSGIAKDYTVNKYNGQIELENVLLTGDEVVAGSPYTRAFVQSTAHENYSVTAGRLLALQVDDIVSSSVTTQVSNVQFRDNALVYGAPRYFSQIDNHYNGLYVRFTDATTTVALRGVYRLIDSYVGTTGQIHVSAIFPAVPAVGDTYEILQIVASPVTASLTSAAIQTTFAPLLRGVNFYGKVENLDTYLRVATNNHSTLGAVRIHALTNDPAVGLNLLALPASTTETSQESNFGFIESANEQNFTFGRNQYCIFVVDNDLTHKTVNVTMDYDGTVSAGVNATTFRASALSPIFTTTDFFSGCRVRFTDATLTVALRGIIRTISTYDPVTGEFTVPAGTPLPAIPAANDTFEIIPTTTKNVCDLLNHRSFTSLGMFTDIEASSNGSKVQITTKTQGTLGSIRCAGGSANDFTIPLLTDGTALGLSTTETIEGLSIGLQLTIDDAAIIGPADVTITDIVGAASPYSVEVSVDSGGTDISAYLVANGAYFRPRNQFNFSIVPSEGIDGYKYYEGLIQECQWTIDGKDVDVGTYPGVKAAGVQIEVRAPVVYYVSVTIDVLTSEGVTLLMVQNDVKSAISNYINNLGVGNDVVVSEIIAAVMGVTGIADATMITPTTNVLISANEIARTSDVLITVG